MSTPCPQPADVNWSNERYNNPQNIKVRQGTVTFVEPCYVTVTFAEGDSIRFLMGEFTSTVAADWLTRAVEVEYHVPTNTLGYIKE